MPAQVRRHQVHVQHVRRVRTIQQLVIHHVRIVVRVIIVPVVLRVHNVQQHQVGQQRPILLGRHRILRAIRHKPRLVAPVVQLNVPPAVLAERPLHMALRLC